MSNNPQTVRRGGISFFGALTILFIGLKLTNNIDWSWWLVLLPLWGPAVAVIVFIILVFLFALLFGANQTVRFK